MGSTRDNNAMHAKPDLRVVLEWKIARSGSVIADVIMPGKTTFLESRSWLQAGKQTGRSKLARISRDDTAHDYQSFDKSVRQA